MVFFFFFSGPDVLDVVALCVWLKAPFLASLARRCGTEPCAKQHGGLLNCSRTWVTYSIVCMLVT